MDIKWFFDNSGPDDVWICLSGPSLRSSGCFKIEAGCKKCGIDYEATPGIDQPTGSWTCEVYSSGAACAVTENYIAQATVEVEECDTELAVVTWFLTGGGFEAPPAKVKYED